jgi:glucose 1-dehydrogenase
MNQRRLAAISGGLGDIGQACALAFAALGVDVAVCDLHVDHRSDELKAQLAGSGVRYSCNQADVSDEVSVIRWLQAVESGQGTPDIVVVNAALVAPAPMRAMTVGNWQSQLDVNLTGAMFVANAAAKAIVAAGKPGHIVFVGSWAAEAPHSHAAAYCVAKAGLRMLMRVMALEYASFGIQVNEVAPGLVEAGLSRQVLQDAPALREQMVSKIPLKRMMTPDEVAWHVANVCDPRNRSMCGATITCDGGLSLATAAGGV